MFLRILFVRLLLLSVCTLPVCGQSNLRMDIGQQVARPETVSKTDHDLPDAPSAVLHPQEDQTDKATPEATKPDSPSPVQAEGHSASLSGTVLDGSGAAVAGVAVSLTDNEGSELRSSTTGTDGSFTIAGLPSGSYRITVTASGFRQSTSDEFTLVADETYQLPTMVLSIAAASTEIVVRPADVIAAEQIKAAEKQRVFGVVRDFYTSYIWDAAPLNTKQKFSLAAHDTFDPIVFAGVSLTAGVEQAKNTFPGYGQAGTGYAKRWGARFVDGRSSDILSRAVFPSLFHQDPRYFYQGSGSNWSRIGHAVSYAFIARSDNGRAMPNYSYFLGNLCSSALANLYYPASSRGANLVFTNFAVGLAGRVGQNLVREFLFKRLTKHVPGNGKPPNDEQRP